MMGPSFAALGTRDLMFSFSSAGNTLDDGSSEAGTADVDDRGSVGEEEVDCSEDVAAAAVDEERKR